MPKFHVINNNGISIATYEKVWTAIEGNFVLFTAEDGGRTIAIVRLAPGERVERDTAAR